MRNHSFYELSTLQKYQEFNIKTSERGLYLSLNDKRLDTSSLFEEPEYGLFELDDIHVTVLEQYEISRKPAVRGDKSSSPFHITLRFSEQDSGRSIVIHDFYSPLDLSRDFHVQLKEGEVTTYLPQQSIDLNKLNQLIEKEMRFVKELVDKNNKHEHDLRRLIDSTYEDLFSRAQQANLFPDTLDENDYHHFEQSLTEIIAHLEQLIYLGHHHESRRLAHAQRELDHLRTPSQSTPPQVREGEAAEEKALTKASKASPQKTASKKGKAQKQKNGAQVQLTAFLNGYYAEAQALRDQKNVFLTDAHRYLLSEPKFDPKALLVHLNSHLDILLQLSNAELEHFVLDFFDQFSTCRDPAKQTSCLEIAEFLSLNIATFSNLMLKLSLTTYEFSETRISGIVMALLNNNIPYWEFMHSYGINFADNRHIIVDGMAGNIIHAIFYLIKEMPSKSFDSMIPFVQLLFKYLEEDGVKLRNMKTIVAVITKDRKKVSTHALFKNQKSKKAAVSDSLMTQFKNNIHKEPYGTFLIMDAVELWLIRAIENQEAESKVAYLIPQLVELFSLVLPHITTTALLQSLQRLLELDVLGIFDDKCCHRLLANADLPPLELFTEFSLVYVGGQYNEPVSKLLDLLLTATAERISTMSNSMHTHLMQDYFMQSKTGSVASSKSILHYAMNLTENYQLVLDLNQKLTFSRMAYFLFTLKAKRGMFLTLEDYQVLLKFYHVFIDSEMKRFTKDNPRYKYQRDVSLKLMEISASTIRALDLPEAVKIPLLASPEFQELLAMYRQFNNERQQELTEQRTASLGVR